MEKELKELEMAIEAIKEEKKPHEKSLENDAKSIIEWLKKHVKEMYGKRLAIRVRSGNSRLASSYLLEWEVKIELQGNDKNISVFERNFREEESALEIMRYLSEICKKSRLIKIEPTEEICKYNVTINWYN